MAARDDCNMLSADCVVISCCCQCLILKFVIFIFLKLPYKLLQKTKRKILARRSISKPGHNDQIIIRTPSLIINLQPEIEIHDRSFCCMEQVDRVLEEMSNKGLFGFGSFWNGEELAEESNGGGTGRLEVIGDT